jgi:hypothetical protein
MKGELSLISPVWLVTRKRMKHVPLRSQPSESCHLQDPISIQQGMIYTSLAQLKFVLFVTLDVAVQKCMSYALHEAAYSL